MVEEIIDNLLKTKKNLICFGLGFALAFAPISYFGLVYKFMLETKEIYSVSDLNNDAVDDLIVDEVLRKTLFYGVIGDDHKIHYLLADEMIKEFPNSKVDYKKISIDLNKEIHEKLETYSGMFM